MAADRRRHNPDHSVDIQSRKFGAPMTEIQLSTQTRDAAVVVAVAGELDVVNSQQFDDYLTEASAGAGKVVLDLSAVDFMDTSALAVVVSHWRRQVDAGGEFLLAGARYRYTKALWITGLADRLPMYAVFAAALGAGQPKAPVQPCNDRA